MTSELLTCQTRNCKSPFNLFIYFLFNVIAALSVVSVLSSVPCSLGFISEMIMSFLSISFLSSVNSYFTSFYCLAISSLSSFVSALCVCSTYNFAKEISCGCFIHSSHLVQFQEKDRENWFKLIPYHSVNPKALEAIQTSHLHDGSISDSKR